MCPLLGHPKIMKVSQNSFSSGGNLVARRRLNPLVWALARASFLGYCETISKAPLKYPMDQPVSFAA